MEKVNIERECTIEVDEFLEIKELGKALVKGILDGLKDDKKPNPIYIPKNIQHRKKGRK